VLEEEYQPRRVLPRELRPAVPVEPPFAFTIRPAVEADLPDIREIYNHYVMNTVITFDEKRMTIKQWKEKFAYVQKLHFPFLVAVSPSGQILGFTYVVPWKPKAAYRFTVENSIYLRAAATGKGLGNALMTELLIESKKAGIKEVIAVIADKGAEASIGMHEKFGFKNIGHMGKVGFKFDRWLGTVLMQKSLK
jgi:phosphinothricin acetyltransferase